MLQPQQKMKLNRLLRVMREGSPKYHYDLAAIAAGAQAYIDMPIAFPLSRKYQPLDTALVINNDAVDISLLFNGAAGQLIIVPAGVIRTISRVEVPAMWSVLITNLDAVAAVTVNLIDIEFSRSPEDADSLARADIQ